MAIRTVSHLIISFTLVASIGTSPLTAMNPTASETHQAVSDKTNMCGICSSNCCQISTTASKEFDLSCDNGQKQALTNLKSHIEAKKTSPQLFSKIKEVVTATQLNPQPDVQLRLVATIEALANSQAFDEQDVFQLIESIIANTQSSSNDNIAQITLSRTLQAMINSAILDKQKVLDIIQSFFFR